MIPTYTNSSSPSFPFELNNNSEVHLHHHDHLSSDHNNNNNIIMNIPHVNPYNNYQFASLSSNSSSCQTFFNMSTTNIQDQRDNYTYHSQFHHPQHKHEVDNFGSRSGSHDHVEKKNKGIKLTFWKKGEGKMKNNLKLEDQKIESTTDHSSNNSSSNNNIPIRVCSDCNTTKTPLWRSGPKGPKSLCNACGIRQRKARRAMAAAAAAAAANGTNFTSSTTETSSTTTTTMKIKVQQQQKQKITKVNTNHVVPFKKRCKFLTTTTTTTTTGPSSSPSPAPTSAPPVRHHVGSSTLSSSSSSSSRQMKKLSFDDFYVDLSNNLGIHRVFPQDEKEAAILLMALSSGLVHG